jgi:hypothetical protein
VPLSKASPPSRRRAYVSYGTAPPSGTTATVLSTTSLARYFAAAPGDGMIKIAISSEAFEAIARTLPLGSVVVEPHRNERGERLVWLEAATAEARRNAGVG